MKNDVQESLTPEQRSGFNRREFLGVTAASAAVVAMGELVAPTQAFAAASSTPIPATLPPLPWANNALEPTITANTLSFHYGKHHKGYLTNLNTMLADTSSKAVEKLQGKSLEEVILLTYKRKDDISTKIYRNAAQVYNHDFYWKSLTPNGGGDPVGEIATLIDQSFGDFGKFKTALIDAATNQFGTGWAWVFVDRNRKINIMGTNDADTVLTLNRVMPLLTIDVWEHAYYLDYQNLRKAHVTAVVEKLLNWDFANQNLAKFRG